MFSIICIDHTDCMNRWCYPHITDITIEARYGDKHPRVYVKLRDGSEDVIDPMIWDCKVVIEN